MTVPYIDPRLSTLRGFVDSLQRWSGYDADSVLQRQPANQRATGVFHPKERRILISPNSRDPRRTASHEYGHGLMFRDPSLFYRFLDTILKVPVGERITDEHSEAFADAFANALEARMRGDSTSTDSGTEFLMRMLPRLTKGSEGAILGVPAAPRPDPRAPALPFLSNVFGER